MFPDDKIIEIFTMCDDFSKNFDDIIQKNSIDARESTKKRKYHRDGTMSDAEVMTISSTTSWPASPLTVFSRRNPCCNLTVKLINN